MSTENDIIASAPTDGPEVLDTDTLDSITGGVEYGGTNTCEPVKHKPSHGEWIELVSVSQGINRSTAKPKLTSG